MVIWCLRLDFVCLIMSVRLLQAVTFERSPCHGLVPSCSSCRLAIFNSNIIFRFFWFLWTRNMSLNSLFMSLQEEVHSDRQLSRYYQRWFPKIKCILQGTQKAGSQAWRRGEHWGMREKSAGGKIDPPAESQGISDVCVCVCVCVCVWGGDCPFPSCPVCPPGRAASARWRRLDILHKAHWLNTSKKTAVRNLYEKTSVKVKSGDEVFWWQCRSSAPQLKLKHVTSWTECWEIWCRHSRSFDFSSWCTTSSSEFSHMKIS